MANTAPRTGYAPVNGLSLYYEIHGAGRAAAPAARRLRRDGDVRRSAPCARRAPPGHRGRFAGPRAHGRHRPPAAHRRPGGRHRRADRAPRARRGQRDGLLLRRGRRPPDRHPAPDVVDRLVVVSTPHRRSAWYQEMLAGMEQMARGDGRADEADPDVRTLRQYRAAPRRLADLVGPRWATCCGGTTTGRPAWPRSPCRRCSSSATTTASLPRAPRSSSVSRRRAAGRRLGSVRVTPHRLAILPGDACATSSPPPRGRPRSRVPRRTAARGAVIGRAGGGVGRPIRSRHGSGCASRMGRRGGGRVGNYCRGVR